MNDLFQDMINQKNMATFIDNIIVATNTEEGHDKLVKEVLKRLEENNLRNKIRKVQEGDERVVKAVEELKKTEMKTLRDEEWTIEKGVIMKEGQIYILERELREKVIQLYHNTPVEEHSRRWKTTELVTRNY